jgi:FixJ family two-component response regulator
MSAPAAAFVAIIDDDEIQCRALGRLVRRAGFHVLTFHSAEDFLLDPERACFGCLLVDIQLSGISGLVLHQRLLAGGVRTPVIYITGHDDSAAHAEALKTGCAGYLRKTDPSSVIIELLRRVTSPP